MAVADGVVQTPVHPHPLPAIPGHEAAGVVEAVIASSKTLRSEHEALAETVRAIHDLNPGTGVENLIPDFNGRPDLLTEVFESRPEVLAHNEAVRLTNRRFRFVEGEPAPRTVGGRTFEVIPISLRRENRRKSRSDSPPSESATSESAASQAAKEAQ